MRIGIRESLLSAGLFCGIFAALITIDPRVRDRLGDLFASGGVSPFGDRLADVGNALWSAATHQSIENAPLVVFAAIGAVLTLFMFRS